MDSYSRKHLDSETYDQDGSLTRLAQKPKYGECWGADMPFANISENRLAKTISMAVSLYCIYTLLMEVIFVDYFYAGTRNTEWKAGKCLQQVTSAAEDPVREENSYENIAQANAKDLSIHLTFGHERFLTAFYTSVLVLIKNLSFSDSLETGN